MKYLLTLFILIHNPSWCLEIEGGPQALDNVTGTLRVANGGTGGTGFASGAIIVSTRVGTTDVLDDDSSQLVWDFDLNRLGVGLSAPLTLLDVAGVAQFGDAATKSTFTAAGALNLAVDLTVANGGTGASTFTDGGIILGAGTGALTATGVLTNGQLLIGDGTTAPTAATLTGTGAEVDVTNGAGTITLGLPDSITLVSTVTVTGNAFSVGASTLVVSSGRLGVGTSSPGTKLHMSSGTLAIDGDIGNVVIGPGTLNQTGTLVIRSTSTTAINPVLNIQNNAGTEIMRVQQNGNIGIGENPSAINMISVLSNASAERAIQMSNQQSDGFTGVNILSNGITVKLSAYGTGATGTTHGISNADLGIINFGSPTNLVIGTEALVPTIFTTNATEKMRISGAGNVGIGSIAPATLLHMSSGTLTIDGNTQLAINAGGTFRPWSRTKAQIDTLVPGAVGEYIHCSDCTLIGLCVSTGTLASQWRKVESSTLGCGTGN